MLFHSKRTITISRLIRVIDNHEIGLVKRVKFWLPRHLIVRAYENLMLEIAETLNKSALEQEIASGAIRVKLYNKAYNLYPALVDLVSITWDKEHLDKIEEITGLKLRKLEDRAFLVSEMKRLQDKYKELAKTEKTDEGVPFAQIVASTEVILGMNISTEKTLQEFQYYMKIASDKIKQAEKAREKING